MTSPAGRFSGSGYCGSSSWSVSATIDATARSRNHFLLAGITYHGAQSVEQRDRASSNAAVYLFQSVRSSRSADLNFQRLFGSSMRSWKRCNCSSGEISRKNFRIVVPSSVSSFSNALIWS